MYIAKSQSSLLLQVYLSYRYVVALDSRPTSYRTYRARALTGVMHASGSVTVRCSTKVNTVLYSRVPGSTLGSWATGGWLFCSVNYIANYRTCV